MLVQIDTAYDTIDGKEKFVKFDFVVLNLPLTAVYQAMYLKFLRTHIMKNKLFSYRSV